MIMAIIINAQNCDGYIKKYYNMVYKLALSQTHSRENAEDVLQDTFYKFIKYGKPFDSEEHIKAWLLRVTINTSKKIFSSSWYKKIVPLEESEELVFEQNTEKSEVYYAITQLPEKYRVAIHLYYYEELSVKEIAQVLDMKPSSVEIRIHRARKLLKKKLKGDYDYE